MVSLLIGWLFGRWSARGKKQSKKSNQAPSYSESYAKGLNFLLTDQSDKAIRTFTELVEVDRDTIEIHITLGNLFRSKGEVDRAIKIHQNLLARPNLTTAQRNMAISELANDFMKAGLHDRAEKLYREMTRLEVESSEESFERLLDLYISEKSWHEACECAQVLYNRGLERATDILSQVHCEIAQSTMQTGNHKLVRKHLDNALQIDPNCVRAGLLLIELHITKQSYIAARKVLQKLIRQNPEYMVLYIDLAKTVYLHEGKPELYQDFLEHQYQTNPSSRLAIALLEHFSQLNQIEQARNFLEQVLQQSPSYEAFDFAFKFLKSEPSQLSDAWLSLSEYLRKLQSKKVEFVCTNCGYGSHSIQWNCPSCNSWSTLKAV